MQFLFLGCWSSLLNGTRFLLRGRCILLPWMILLLVVIWALGHHLSLNHVCSRLQQATKRMASTWCANCGKKDDNCRHHPAPREANKIAVFMAGMLALGITIDTLSVLTLANNVHVQKSNRGEADRRVFAGLRKRWRRQGSSSLKMTVRSRLPPSQFEESSCLHSASR